MPMAPVTSPIVAIVLSVFMLSAHADALQDGLAAVQRKDYPAATRLLEPLARNGDPSAQWQIGLLYYHGHGVRESDALALQWFERAARQEPGMGTVSRETVRRMLKKTTSSPGAG